MGATPIKKKQISHSRRMKTVGIWEVVKLLTQIEEIYLDYNRIKTLPKCVSELTSLKLISLYFNGFKAEPEDFTGEIKYESPAYRNLDYKWD